MNVRHYSFADQLLIQFNQRLQYLFGMPQDAVRTSPAEACQERPLSKEQKRHSAGLMRVNHSGEVCAQALYEGQALTARSFSVKQNMQKAAQEEVDHLAWCFDRLNALDSHVSYLNPIWYAGSFSIGVLAGVLGDQWSLGFLAETERQVVAHIEKHLKQLPVNDQKSSAVLKQMKIDEGEHATMAVQNGAAELPVWVKTGMRWMSRVMTKTAYWV